MITFKLERELKAAQARLQRAAAALAPKHQGGEVEEFQSARAAVLSLERQLAAARGQEYAEPFDFPVQWDAGAPMPHLLLGSLHTFLVFYVSIDDPNWDGTHVKIRNPESSSAEPLAFVQFHHCVSAKFGAPNDEVLHGHPLSHKGLEGYTAQIVHNSKWINELETMNKVHSNYKSEFWRPLKHYVFWFHDETFECVARSYEVEVVYESLPDLLARLTKQLVA